MLRQLPKIAFDFVTSDTNDVLDRLKLIQEERDSFLMASEAEDEAIAAAELEEVRIELEAKRTIQEELKKS